jgi:putative tryptophan/tyrosine transport system substrate-binding protein
MRRIGLVLALSLTLAPLVAEAQRSSTPRVGVLSPGKPPPDDAFRQQERFEAGLRELGWTPGSNVVIDYRYAEGNLDRLPALVAELVRTP